MLVMLSLGLPASCAAVATSLTTPTVKAAASHPAAWESSVTPLHLAVMEGSSADVELLLATGEDFAGADFDGQTPLHVAAAAGEDEIINQLIEAGADVNAIDSFSFTPLRWAALNGHAGAVHAMLAAGADGTHSLEGLSALELSCAAGHIGVAATLIGANAVRDDGCAFAIELAAEMGHAELAAILTAVAADEDGILPSAAAAWEQVDKEEHGIRSPEVVVVDADELARDATLWTQAFATSTPLLVRGCATDWSDDLSAQSPAELRERWGDHQVTVAWSDDALYHRPVSIDGYGESKSYALREMPLERMRFDRFVDLLPSHGKHEYFAVSQSATGALDGLHTSEPSETGLPAPLGQLIGPSFNRKNLWVCAPPKVSETHFDEDDSVLLQLSGTKRFTLIAPGPYHGLTAYPSVLPARELQRVAPGVFESRSTGDKDPSVGRTLSHFALVNASKPDLGCFPLSRLARTLTVDVEEGCALLLPAYWYHRVESFAPPDRLNVAVNVWFDEDVGGGAPAHLHRQLRKVLHVDHT